MTNMIMMCGLPGSGKSTYAEKLEKEGYIIHSSDKIREELGDVNDQSKNEEVFKILHQRIKADLKSGKSIVYDATNLNRRRRIAFLKELQNISCKKICVLVATPFEKCLLQNLKRERTVPRDVLDRMYRNFQIPCVQEGFDEVIVHYPNEEWKAYYGDALKHIIKLCNFSQENHHHKLTLGDHMIKAGSYILEQNGGIWNDITYAAFTHDIGKFDTKDFKNSKGEPTDDAHYFGHHNVGCYKSLFFNYPKYVNKEYVALLIELHMNPFLSWKQSENAKEKDRTIFGENVISDIELLHCADLYGH